MSNPTSAPALPRIGLALSGGGFRATLFHLGVVRYLYEAGLLRRVTHICSVSGGSIIAAHLALHWDEYTGTPEEFDRAAGELVAFARKDVRGRVLRRWAFSGTALWLPRLFGGGRWNRTALLQAEYDALYQGKTLGDLEKVGGPKLHVIATSMTNGQLVSFGEGRITVCQPLGRPGAVGPTLPTVDEAPAGAVPLGLAVAASSAFPPLFPPVKVTHETLGLLLKEFEHDHYLGDGGVFDNLGIRKLLWLAHPDAAAPFDVAVVSDAQWALALAKECEYTFLKDRATRSIDMMMDQTSVAVAGSLADWSRRTGMPAVFCRLQDRLDPGDPLRKEIAEETAVVSIRTDLDAFEPHEVNALVDQGFAVARRAWQESAGAAAGDPYQAPGWQPWRPCTGVKSREVQPRAFSWAGLPLQVGSLLFQPRDRYGLANLGVVALGFLVAAALVWRPYVLLGRQSEELKTAQTDLKVTAGKLETTEEKLGTTARQLQDAQQQIGEIRRAYEWELFDAAAAYEHTAKKFRLLQRAYKLASAATEQDILAAREGWEKNLTDQYYADWGFFDRDGVGEAITAINERLKTRPAGSDSVLQGLADNLAVALRKWHREWGAFNRQYANFIPLRNDAYREVVDLSTRITGAQNPGAVKEQRERFHLLRIGVLNLLTEEKIGKAMAQFDWQLVRWEGQAGPPPPELKAEGKRLADLIAAEIAGTPK